MTDTLKIFAGHTNITQDQKIKLSKTLVRLLRYDYDKYGLTVDRDGWFEVTSLLHAEPLRHYQMSHVLERLATETNRFNIDGDKVRVYLSEAKPAPRRRHKTGTPDFLTYNIYKDSETTPDTQMTLLADDGKSPITSQAAYPTDARMRQKAKEAEEKKQAEASGVALKPKQKKKQQIEDHRDDCGSDLNSLLPYLKGGEGTTLKSLLCGITTELPM